MLGEANLFLITELMVVCDNNKVRLLCPFSVYDADASPELSSVGSDSFKESLVEEEEEALASSGMRMSDFFMHSFSSSFEKFQMTFTVFFYIML